MLSLAHIFLLALSNVLVQYPIQLFGSHTTWGAFSYPLIFIITDLTTRTLGANQARRVVFRAMLPGFLISFALSFLIEKDISAFLMILRIYIACFTAYSLVQLMDIALFNKIRQVGPCYLAPLLAGLIGNMIDTYVFFFIAFYRSSQTFFALHWVQIATVDLMFKCLISTFAFVPLYGLTLNFIYRFKEARVNSVTQ